MGDTLEKEKLWAIKQMNAQTPDDQKQKKNPSIHKK